MRPQHVRVRRFGADWVDRSSNPSSWRAFPGSLLALVVGLGSLVLTGCGSSSTNVTGDGATDVARGDRRGGDEDGPSVERCRRSPDCRAPTPFCDQGQGICVACLDSSQCPGGAQCDPRSGTCVISCDGDGDCQAPTPLCDPVSSTCVGCLGPGDCSEP